LFYDNEKDISVDEKLFRDGEKDISVD